MEYLDTIDKSDIMAKYDMYEILFNRSVWIFVINLF